ncbi:TRAM domain-containing protein [Halobellus rubicundus]|uniref:TRAM domain-containing protein n=1 Tax=Halobellus rubicundus TaxID=2996466 RepID=A0ABD5MKM6_9EURY
MAEIPDSLRLLFEATLEEHGDRYSISIPQEMIDESSLTTNDVFRVALLAAPDRTRNETDDREIVPNDDQLSTSQWEETPPVEEGEIRSVTIDTLGDQGDGLAKVERGFIVIVPGTQPGDKAEVRITDVRESVAFAEPVTDPEVR